MKDRSDVEKLEKLIGQLYGLHSEVTLLAKKSPSDAVNSFKLGLINKVINIGTEVLGQDYVPFREFVGFDIDDMPSTSDVAMVLSQYIEEAERYRSDNVKLQYGHWVYVLDGSLSDIRSGMPVKIGRR